MTDRMIGTRREFLEAAALGMASLAHGQGEASAAFDVVVFGATPAGVCAAVAAARKGVSAVLVEPENLVGGMMSCGLSFSDSNQCDRQTLGGLFDEVHRRIADDYCQRALQIQPRMPDAGARSGGRGVGPGRACETARRWPLRARPGP